MIIYVILLEMITRCKDFLFFFSKPWDCCVELCTHFPGTQMCATPNYLVDENWNKSTVIDVKALFQACK